MANPAVSTTTHASPSAPRRMSTAAAAFKSPVLAIVVSAFMLLAHIGWSYEIYPLEARLGAALLGLLAFLALRAASPDRLPFVPMAAVQVYLTFGIPTFYEQRLLTISGPAHLSDESLNNAVFAALLSLALMYLAAFPGRAFGQLLRPHIGRLLPRARISVYASGIRMWSALALVAHLLVGLTPNLVPDNLAFAATVVFAPTVPQVLLFLLWRETQASRDRKIFFAVTGVTAFMGFLSGMLVAAFTPILVAAILEWTASRRFPVTLAAAAVIAFLVLNPAKHVFRQRSWTSESAGLIEKVTHWTDAIGSTWTGDKVEVSERLKQSADRMSSLLYVAHTLEWVPRYVPFAGLERWWPIAYSYVPRIVWPTKPDLTGVFNKKYTIAFGLQTEAGTATTTIHVPLMSDAYWALGWLGVAVAGGLVGLLLGSYEGAFARDRWGGWSIGMLFLSRLQATSHLGATFTGIAQVFVAGSVALWGVAALTALNRVRPGA